jgi:hypothetical protein
MCIIKQRESFTFLTQEIRGEGVRLESGENEN